ncbi:unnamed protein product [Closterium sp. Yama58-4]|nr:unnamed protein product [Closterium sp. Yama58-4]
MAAQSTSPRGSGAIPKPASAPTSTYSDPYADGLRAAIAETERIAATAQATAAAAPDNAAARDLARVPAESLESTRKRLSEHLATPSPRSAPTPSASAPSHSDLLADWHVANARACQVILVCLPSTLLPQCSHIPCAKDLLGYLTERFQSQTPISVIALLRELTSLRLADFTTMADYIARVQTLSSQLAAQKFELSDHVCGALLLTGLTPEYSVHVTLYDRFEREERERFERARQQQHQQQQAQAQPQRLERVEEEPQPQQERVEEESRLQQQMQLEPQQQRLEEESRLQQERVEQESQPQQQRAEEEP